MTRQITVGHIAHYVGPMCMFTKVGRMAQYFSKVCKFITVGLKAQYVSPMCRHITIDDNRFNAYFYNSRHSL